MGDRPVGNFKLAGFSFLPKRSAALTSRIMAAVQSKDTEPERRLGRALRSLKCRFRRYAKDVPGCPDFVFTRERVAVFVDGDFWHGRQWRLRGLRSLASQFSRSPNRAYWIQKITRNVARDRKTTRLLKRLGWRVVRLWESEVKAAPARCVKRVACALERAS